MMKEYLAWCYIANFLGPDKTGSCGPYIQVLYGCDYL